MRNMEEKFSKDQYWQSKKSKKRKNRKNKKGKKK